MLREATAFKPCERSLSVIFISSIKSASFRWCPQIGTDQLSISYVGATGLPVIQVVNPNTVITVPGTVQTVMTVEPITITGSNLYMAYSADGLIQFPAIGNIATDNCMSANYQTSLFNALKAYANSNFCTPTESICLASGIIAGEFPVCSGAPGVTPAVIFGMRCQTQPCCVMPLNRLPSPLWPFAPRSQ